jgi:hypothetical protein
MGAVVIVLVAVVTGGLVLTGAVARPAEVNAAPNPKWEYRVFPHWQGIAKLNRPDVEYADEWTMQDFEKGLAKLGNEGWELVAVQGEGSRPEEKTTYLFDKNYTRYYFKRQK